VYGAVITVRKLAAALIEAADEVDALTETAVPDRPLILLGWRAENGLLTNQSRFSDF
jgi:hypothetical protein